MSIDADRDRVLAFMYMYWGMKAYAAMNKDATLTQCFALGWAIYTFYL